MRASGISDMRRPVKMSSALKIWRGEVSRHLGVEVI